jgi:hypothetical protein
MAQKHSFIPRADAKYDAFFKNVVDTVQAKCNPQDAPEWGHIPASEQTDLRDAYTDWHTHYAKTLKPHLPGDTAAKKAAFTRSFPVLSRFIQVWFRGFPEEVTEEDLANMAIPPIDKEHTPIGRPKTRPIFDVLVQHIRSLTIEFQDEAEGGRIPYGMSGAVISWMISDAPPPEAGTAAPHGPGHPEPLYPHLYRGRPGQNGLDRHAVAERNRNPRRLYRHGLRDYSLSLKHDLKRKT